MSYFSIISTVYVCVLNIVGLAVMWLDKAKSQRNAWRIPEKSLFIVSLIGGSIGTWVGMYIFRHKTKHWYFVLGMPSIFGLHLILVYYLYTHNIISLH